MTTPLLFRWTRTGLLPSRAGQTHENFERLVIHDGLRARLRKTAAQLVQGREPFEVLRLPWRRGLFFYGGAGSGKSAAARALALELGAPLFVIPEHEVLDSHALEKALHECTTHPAAGRRVLVLDHLDLMLGKMEPQTFFELLDLGMERSDGWLWIGTTRHAEAVPKTQLVRPGRLEESIHFDAPAVALRESLIQNLPVAWNEAGPGALTELVAQSEGLSFAHFEEMRRICAMLLLENREGEIFGELRTFVAEQIISGDRLGAEWDLTDRVHRRLNELDPRLVQAALNITDALMQTLDKALGDALDKSRPGSGLDAEAGGNA